MVIKTIGGQRYPPQIGDCQNKTSTGFKISGKCYKKRWKRVTMKCEDQYGKY